MILVTVGVLVATLEDATEFIKDADSVGDLQAAQIDTVTQTDAEE